MLGPPGKSTLGLFPRTKALGIRIWLCFCMDLGALAFLKGNATHGDSHPERRHSAGQTQWCHQHTGSPKAFAVSPVPATLFWARIGKVTALQNSVFLWPSFIVKSCQSARVSGIGLACLFI